MCKNSARKETRDLEIKEDDEKDRDFWRLK